MSFNRGKIISELELDSSKFIKGNEEATSFVKGQAKEWSETVDKTTTKMTKSIKKHYTEGEHSATSWKKTWTQVVDGVKVIQEEVGKDFIKTEKQKAAEAEKAQQKIIKAQEKAAKNLIDSQQKAVEKSKEQTAMWSTDWWKRFGQVAVGFTVAYRAMNLIEDGIRKMVTTFKEGIQHIDDFKISVIETAAALQTLSAQTPAEMFGKYVDFAEWAFREMEIVAVKHLATGEQLQQAFAELTTHGIVAHTREDLEILAQLTDYILMQTRGQLNVMSQIRTEIEPIILAEKRRNAIVERRFEVIIAGFKEEIKRIEKMPDAAERTAAFFDVIKKGLTGVAASTDEILGTQYAWSSTLDVILKRIQRTGLMGAYQNILRTMIGISEVLMDENGLTETGLELAYKMHDAWNTVWTAVSHIAAISLDLVAIYNQLTMNLRPISNFFKGWVLLLTAVITVSRQVIHAHQALMKAQHLDFKGAREELEKAKRIDEEWVADMEKLFAGEDAFKDHLKSLELSLELRREIISSLRAYEKGEDENAAATKRWIDDVKKLQDEYKILRETAANIMLGLDKDEIKRLAEYNKIIQQSKDVPEKQREAWLKLKLDILEFKNLNKDLLAQRDEEIKKLKEIEALEKKRADLRETATADWNELQDTLAARIKLDKRLAEQISEGVIDVEQVAKIKAEFKETERVQKKLNDLAEKMGIKADYLVEVYGYYVDEQKKATKGLKETVDLTKQENAQLKDALKLQTNITDALEQRSIKAAMGVGMSTEEITRMIDMLAESERMISMLNLMAASKGANADAARALALEMKGVNDQIRQSVPVMQNYNLQLRVFAQDAVAAQVRLLGGTQDIFEGAQVAQDEYLVNMKTWAEMSHAMISGEIYAIEDAFTELFKNVLINHENWGDALKIFWTDLMTSIAEIYIQEMTKMMVIKSFAALGLGSEGLPSLGGSGGRDVMKLSSGGFASLNIPSMHEGGVVGMDLLPNLSSGLNSKEYLTVLEKDESVFTAAQTKVLGKMLSQPAPTVNLDIANFMSPDVMDAYLASARGQNALINAISSRSESFRRIIR